MIVLSISPVYQAIFTTPQLALNSCMACRVFRGLRLGYIAEVDGSFTQSADSRQTDDLPLQDVKLSSQVFKTIAQSKSSNLGTVSREDAEKGVVALE
jgi:hypothetical protein